MTPAARLRAAVRRAREAMSDTMNLGSAVDYAKPGEMSLLRKRMAQAIKRREIALAEIEAIADEIERDGK